MPIATGVFKKLSFKKQTGLGVIAPPGGAGTAQYLRRVSSSVDLKKETYQSGEILTSQQRRDYRHGVRKVDGSINGEISVGTYQKFFESVCRQVVQTAATTGAIITVTAAVTSGSQGTFTRSAGSYITDGFKIGDVVQWSGWATTGVPNNAHNMIIIALTATVMTVATIDGIAIGAKAAGDSVTCTVVGKKTWVPQTGHTRDYYTIEHWFSDIAQSEYFQDCVITGAKINLNASGMATVEFPVLGLNMLTGTAEYFTTPAAPSTGGIFAAINGLLVINGAVVGVLTGIQINIDGGYSVPGGVIGANVDPDVFPGVLTVTGQATILFQNNTYRDMFLNETIAALTVVLTANNTAAAPFMAITMSQVKFGGASKDDGTAGLTLTLPFQALENITGSLVDLPTTISIQDSAYI